jgi:dTDP-4-amino-4,6-dideoxygalactose transaminase
LSLVRKDYLSCGVDGEAPSPFDEFLPFARPCLDRSAIDDVVACMESGWLATGPRVQAFESALRDYFSAPHVFAVNSATSGLFLALRSLELQEGDEVITTPMTFVATLHTIVQSGATPVLVDIDESTRNICVKSLEKAITSRTKAIMPVHFAGLPVCMDEILSIANKHGLCVIEDAAHAMGATYNGRVIGSFGHVQVFSFHPCKNMTSAEGGCVVIHDDSLVDKFKKLRFFGIDRDAWNRHAKGGSSAYDVTMLGYKCNMSDLQAAIGLSQLHDLDAMNHRRRQLVSLYRKHLMGIEGIALPGAEECDGENAWHIFTVLIDSDRFGISRDELESALKSYNIGSGHHYPAVHLYSYYKERYGFKEGAFPIAESVGSRIISLPLFPHMSDKDVQKVCNIFRHIKGCLSYE